MGQKVHSKGFRLRINRDWDSRYYASKKEFPGFVKSDFFIRSLIKQELRLAAISHIEIERAGQRIRVTIHTGRRGVVIGRKGQDLDKLRDKIKIAVAKASAQKLAAIDIILEVQEVAKPELNAQLVAEGIALQIERRASLRRVLKRAVQTSMSLGADGIRVQCSGRLGGAEIARVEKQREGRVPLHTLREQIQYGFSEASTVYGLIGVKCWICHKSKNN